MMKTWLDRQSVRDIQVFLGFANFYRRFIKNFGKIAALLTSILQITKKLTNIEPQSTQAKKQDIPNSVSGIDSIGGDIENLLSIVELAKSKKLNLTKSNSLKTNFLFLGAKKAFIYL